MTPEQRFWWQVSLELKLRKHSGNAFQDFFSAVMAKAHGTDFVRIRPFGSLGDKGCDGYLLSLGHVYQCYGALGGSSMKVAVLVEKMGDDFAKALIRHRLELRRHRREDKPVIVSITSSLPTFKTVQFKEGLNVLLANTRPGATQKQTRNSAGKTSLIEIIHFLMASNADKDSIFRSKALIDHTFTGVFKIQGHRYEIERGGADPSKIFLLSGGENRADLPTKIDKASGRRVISNTNWRIFLGHVMFGMPADIRGTAFDDPGTPSFRALFSYFARRRDSGAFLYPERQAEQQQRGDWQVNLSYLLGLDWRIPFEFQKIRARERTLEELKKAATWLLNPR